MLHFYLDYSTYILYLITKLKNYNKIAHFNQNFNLNFFEKNYWVSIKNLYNNNYFSIFHFRVFFSLNHVIISLGMRRGHEKLLLARKIIENNCVRWKWNCAFTPVIRKSLRCFLSDERFSMCAATEKYMRAYIYQSGMFCAGRPASGCVGTVCLQVN